MWIGADGLTAAYAGVNVHDWMLCLISAFNSFCCIIVVILTVYKRNEYRQGATMGGEDALAQRAMTPLCPANACCSHSLALPYGGRARPHCESSPYPTPRLCTVLPSSRHYPAKSQRP